MIYQLAKTSPLLSGQVRWDMCLSYGDSKPEVSSLHIVPLNNRINYNERNNRNDLNYTHQENIKYLYNQISGDFYSSMGLRDTEYYIFNEGITEDPFDHTYEMGAKRIRYNRYNKQFSFLCPMWISESIDYSKLGFRFVIGNYSTIVYLDQRMVDYLTHYMDGVGDELLNIKFDPPSAYIMGLQVDAAKFSVIDISYVLQNLISRERPMMEFDGMILDLFRQNNIISRQLINFNFIFNINDICPEFVARELARHDINIKLEAYYNNQLIEIRDLYSNYTDIPSYNISKNEYESTRNVFDYLQDDMCQALAYVNKTTQPIFHWSLLENPDIIYNLYNGFSPIYSNSDGEKVQISGRYYNQCDIRLKNYDAKSNNIRWCKHWVFDKSKTQLDFIKLLQDNDKFTPCTLKRDVCWCGGNRYDLTNSSIIDWDGTELSDDFIQFNIATVLLKSKSQIPKYLINNELVFELTRTSTPLYICVNGNNFVFAATDINNLTLATIVDVFKNFEDRSIKEVIYEEDDIEEQVYVEDEYDELIYIDATEAYIHSIVIGANLISMFDSWVEPYKIEFFKTVIPKKILFDNKYSNTIEYYKKDNSHYSYVYRYTGKLIPSMIPIDDIDKHSLSFRYKQWGDVSESDPNIPEYNRLLKAGYSPKYPDTFYSLIPCTFKSTKDNWYDEWCGDITWMNDGRVWNVPPEINIKYLIEDYKSKTPDQIENQLWLLLYEWFGQNNSDNMKQYLCDPDPESKHGRWCMKYLKSLYQMTMTFDYQDIKNVNDIIYNIKFSLV